MSLPYTAEQMEFRDTLRGFLTENSSKTVGLGKRLLEELGLEAGFIGEDRVFGFRELSIVAGEVGRSLLPEPIVDQLFIRGVVPYEFASSSTIQKEIPNGLAIISPLTGTKLNFFSKKVSGELSAIPCSADAKALLIVEPGCLVLLDAKNCTHSEVNSLDLTRDLHKLVIKEAQTFDLDPSKKQLLRAAIESLRASEIAGACERVVEMTVEYLKTREQFGVPIGSLQAVQHGAADIYLWSEQITALAEFAAWSIVSSQAQALLAARSALMIATSRGTQLIEKSIQLHGGIGFTWEYDLHLYLRRVGAIEALYLASSAQEELLALRP